MSARKFFVGLCAVVGVLLVVSASAFASAPETPGPVNVEWSNEGPVHGLTFKGLLNPSAEGEAGTYEFVYKASKTECQGTGTGRGLALGLMREQVSEIVTGLSPGTEYSVCLLARNLGGEVSVGAPTTFTTTATPVTEKATSVTASSAVLHGTLNPSNPGSAGSYYFLYAISANKCQGGEETSAISAAGHQQEAVSSEVTGLLPNTTYTFCAAAINSVREPAVGGPVTFTTPSGAPLLGEVSSQDVSMFEATLTARANLGGASTSYRVEYGPSLPYTSSTPEQSVYSTNPINLQVHLSNLQPGVIYHYRFVLSNAFGTVESSDYTFTTQSEAASSSLPDKRVYELVTPPDNNFGSEVYQPEESGISRQSVGTETGLPFQAAANGERLAFVGGLTEGGSEFSGLHGGNEYLAARQPGGGWKQTNITPASRPSSIYQAFSSDLSVGYLDAIEPLSSIAPGFGETPPGLAGNYDVLYSTTVGSNEFSPIFSVKPPYRTQAEFRTAGNVRRASYNGGSSGNRGYAPRVVALAGASADSSHVLFMANDALTGASEGRPAAEGGPENVFEGEDNLYDSTDGQLQLVNILPNGTTHAGATFGYRPLFNHVISDDGSRIFWTDLSTGHIYVRENGTTTIEISSAGQYQTATSDGSKVFYINGDLYEYELNGAHTTDLTPGVTITEVVGASENGEYVYFVTGTGELEVWHDGAIVPIKATHVSLGEVSPDGHSVVFYNGLVQVYNVDTGRLYCASCSSGGTAGELQSTNEANVYQPRWISADGDRVFFDSPEGLVPQDTDGRLDVYEWQRPGSGGCETGEGCVHLLSGGKSSDESYFLDASENGNDVFISTRAKLLGADDNELYDVYDVRADGSEPVAPPACSGTGCQGVPGAPPIFATPSSVTFEGVGNFAPPAKEATKPKAKPKPKKRNNGKKSKGRKKATRKSGKSKAKKSASNANRQKRSGVKGGRS